MGGLTKPPLMIKNLGIVEIISPVKPFLNDNLCYYAFGITFDF